MDQEKELQFLSGEDNTDGLYINGKVKWFKDADGHIHYGEYYIPDDEILEAVGIKTKKLFDNHKGWLPKKVARKVAEHFKLKLFDDATNKFLVGGKLDDDIKIMVGKEMYDDISSDVDHPLNKFL